MTTRRSVTAAAALLVFAGCDRQAPSPAAPGPSAESGELHVYIWADYLKPQLVQRFERENNCKVIIDTFDSNETMYAKLKAGASGYDIAVPSSYMVKLMQEQQMLSPIDHALVPNVVNIDGSVLNKVADKMLKHSVPYAIGYTVIAYRKDKVPNISPTWAVFERPDLTPRTTLLNDMRETIGAALKFLGYSLNTRDQQQIDQARDLVIRWKRNAAKFDNEAYKAGIDSGEFSAVMGYSGDLFQVVSENRKVGILLPREGIAMSCDEFVILKDAPKPLLAHQFINFFLDPKVAAENMEWMGYLCPNKEALKLVSRTFLDNPAVSIPDDVKLNSEVIEDLGPDIAKYTRAWDQIKAAD